MNEFLMFHLYGPMQSWGGIAVGEVRPEERHPSLSGVLGLVAAAMGIRRDQEADLADLDQRLCMAVRIRSAGTLLRDYHTTQVPPAGKARHWLTRADELSGEKLNTILSTRDYRADALYAVALWQRDPVSLPYDLSALARAFLRPHFHLYLGRKACPPAFPIRPEAVEAANLAEAFAGFPVPEHLRGLPDVGAREVYFERGAEGSMETLFQVTRRDRLLSRRRWTYSNREECMGRLPETEKQADKES